MYKQNFKKKKYWKVSYKNKWYLSAVKQISIKHKETKIKTQ